MEEGHCATFPSHDGGHLTCGAAGPVEDRCSGEQNVRAMDGSEPRDLSMAQVWNTTMVDERYNGGGVQPLRAAAGEVRGRDTMR
ncbi:hypothetical protein E2562_017142 [Oryza meyeriana var. granulata]|uniref:Uncharacterized protein n=1 Tax=Oryza meyeriana var. granulata TaxID=110450 RepID=A0A6G1DYR3_9ORYZ|nr:hypothetical protein E2562_017142 [Oryza meyeriana var. granulata]